jgi:hypothetical protein
MATPISKGKASETKNDGQMQIDTSEGHAREVTIYDIDVAETAEKKRKTVNYSPTNATTQDLHPYARGAVIEVWYRAKKEEADDWWSEPESEEDDDESVEKTVRLCDVIDRAQNENTGKWRYYVHYKDFNRRMDEWISVDRIVSPPSVGNAKARALKKEEEREKKKKQKKEEEEKALMDWTQPRSRRRASAVDISKDDMNGRRRRLSRKKSFNTDDDNTVVASNVEEDDEEYQDEKEKSNEEMLALPTDTVTTHTVGEHVVATVKAQELDEHEGLDEASLREHEEVTKVKNVGFMELGQ